MLFIKVENNLLGAKKCTFAPPPKVNKSNLLWCSFPSTSLNRVVKLLEAVGVFLDTVDADQPVLCGVCLLQIVQLYVLVANLGITSPVKPRRSSEIQLQQ